MSCPTNESNIVSPSQSLQTSPHQATLIELGETDPETKPIGDEALTIEGQDHPQLPQSSPISHVSANDTPLVQTTPQEGSPTLFPPFILCGPRGFLAALMKDEPDNEVTTDERVVDQSLCECVMTTELARNPTGEAGAGRLFGACSLQILGNRSAIEL